MQVSRRHHYVPQFLIKNFAAEDGLLYLLDKQTGRIAKQRQSPKAVFFEMDRNTVLFNGQPKDHLETLYAALDDKAAIDLHNVLLSRQASPEEVVSIVALASSLKWRIPASDPQFGHLKEELSLADLKAEIRPIDQTKPVDQLALNQLVASDAIKEAKRILLPLLPLFDEDKLTDIHASWFIHSHADDQFPSVIGDCPLLERPHADYSKLELIQAVDIHAPQLDEVVTFTTLIVNKGRKTATGVTIQNILSSSLKVVYFYADKGIFESIGGAWGVGNVNGGETLKLIIKAKVTQPGLAYCTSYIWRQNGVEKNMKNPVPNVDEHDYGVSCVSVPVSLKKDETYRVTLKRYKGVKWYYKNVASGLYEEITKDTSPNVAVINKDSSLSIAKGGEYTFSKASGTCNITSCCPILVEGCVGP
ncbi:MAG: DUF4238 domain-containing protein, partial [Hymenobacter sp.]